MKKFLKFAVCSGMIAVAALVAIQFQPVRDALKKVGVPL